MTLTPPIIATIVTVVILIFLVGLWVVLRVVRSAPTYTESSLEVLSFVEQKLRDLTELTEERETELAREIQRRFGLSETTALTIIWGTFAGAPSKAVISRPEAMRRLLLVQEQLGYPVDLTKFSAEEIETSLRAIQKGEVFYVLNGAGIVRVDMTTGKVVDGLHSVKAGVTQVEW